MVSTFTKADERIRETLIHAYKDFQRAARDRKKKLIEYRVDGKLTTQLFDTSKDPWETENLSGRPEHLDDIIKLRSELDRWHSEFGDPTAPWWNG